MAAKLPARLFPRETMDNERAVEVSAIVGGDRARLNEGRLHAALAQRAASLSRPPEFSKSDLFQSFFVGGFECSSCSERVRAPPTSSPCSPMRARGLAKRSSARREGSVNVIPRQQPTRGLMEALSEKHLAIFRRQHGGRWFGCADAPVAGL